MDPWEFVTRPGYEDALYGGKVAKTQTDMDAIYRGVLVRFSAQLACGRVVVHRGKSSEIAGQLEDESLDWAYIDGDHTYDAVRLDVSAWWPMVRSGGLLMGDDYGRPPLPLRPFATTWWDDGVTRAVDEFVAGEHLAPVALSKGQFVLRKP